MRLGILIRDAEYSDALVRKLSSYDNDIFVNVIENKGKDISDSVILTDIHPSELDSKVLNALKHRTVFITSSGKGIPEDCNSVFKFSSIPEILSEVSLIYNQWYGKGYGIGPAARLITVCCETDTYAADRCRALAAHIIYSHGGSVLILPLSYINDYGIADIRQTNSLSRLLYSIRSGRDNRLESVTYTDSYGVSSLLIAPGRNPVAYLDEDELRMLVSGLSKKFDTIIADAASCFRKENISIMKSSDKTVFFERGRRETGIEEMMGDESLKKLIRIKLTGGTDDVIAMDDCLKRIFGTENDESIKSRNS